MAEYTASIDRLDAVRVFGDSTLEADSPCAACPLNSDAGRKFLMLSGVKLDQIGEDQCIRMSEEHEAETGVNPEDIFESPCGQFVYAAYQLHKASQEAQE